MGEWFRDTFGEHYLQLYSHRDSAEATTAVDLVIKETGLSPGHVVLDAPCGAGRHLKIMRDRGMKAFGFDLSIQLVQEAVALESNARRIVRADLRAIPFRPGAFDLLVNMFSSLGYLGSDEENRQVVKNLVGLVKPGGWLVVDFMNSDYVRKNLQRESHRVTADALQVQDIRTIEGKPPRINKKTVVTFPDGREKEFRESVRLYTPYELNSILADAGVIMEKEFGSYHGDSPGIDAPRIILIGRRA